MPERIIGEGRGGLSGLHLPDKRCTTLLAGDLSGLCVVLVTFFVARTLNRNPSMIDPLYLQTRICARCGRL